MAAGIPLPALGVRDYQPESPTDQIGKLVQLRSALNQQQMQQGQLQLQQQQIKDQQAMTAAMKTWDGKDYDSLSKSVLQNGGSANAATQIQQHGLTIKKTVSDIAKQDAETGSKNLETFTGKQKAIGDAISGLSDVPDEQLHQAVIGKINDLVQGGVLDQQHAQGMVQQVGQIQDPTQLRNQLQILAKTSAGAQYAAEQAKSAAQTRKDTAEAGKAEQETAFYQRNPLAGAPGVPAETVSLMDYMRTPAKPGEPMHTPSNYPAWKAKQEAIQTAPQKIAVAEAEGRARANIEREVAVGGDAAVKNVATHLIAPAKADANKAGQEYAAAKSVSDRMNATMDAARRGNVISYQIIPEEGTLQITTSQGVHRINKTEIDQYAGGGSLWQRMEGHFGHALTGQSIPASVLDDMAEIQKIQAQGARSKYENSLKTINDTYGSEFKPVQMGGLNESTGDFFSKFGGKSR